MWLPSWGVCPHEHEEVMPASLGAHQMGWGGTDTGTGHMHIEIFIAIMEQHNSNHVHRSWVRFLV